MLLKVIKVKNVQFATIGFLIDEKNLKDLVIYCTRYVNCKLIKTLSLFFYKLLGEIVGHEGKKYLMVDDYMLNKALDKTKEIMVIEKFDDTKILINTDDKLSDDITFKKVGMLLLKMTINFIHCYF